MLLHGRLIDQNRFSFMLEVRSTEVPQRLHLLKPTSGTCWLVSHPVSLTCASSPSCPEQPCRVPSCTHQEFRCPGYPIPRQLTSCSHMLTLVPQGLESQADRDNVWHRITAMKKNASKLHNTHGGPSRPARA